MGWFEEQIKQREELDRRMFEDSFFHAAEAVLGKKTVSEMSDERIITKQAAEDILKYYHLKSPDLPDRVRDAEEQLELMLRPHGIMYRNIELEEGWYKDSYGPVLAYLKEDKTAAALLPKKIAGYYYIDRKTGKKIALNSKTADLFERDAYCFYKPLPLRKLGIPDLILYMKSYISVSDSVIVGLASLAVSLVGIMILRITKALTGPVLLSGRSSVLPAAAVCMICMAASSDILLSVSKLVSQRFRVKTSLSVEAAMMMRILSLPASFFRRYSAGELTKRSQSVNQLCTVIMGMFYSVGLSSLTSLLYVTQIFSFAPTLVVPSLLILLLTLTINVISSFMQIRISRKHLEHEAKQTGMAYSMITGIQKIKLAGAEKRIFAKWLDIYSEGAELIYGPPMFLKLHTVINLAITLGSNILLYSLAAKSGIDSSSYLAFNAAYGCLMGAFTMISGIALQVAAIQPILEMAEPFLSAEPETTGKNEIVTKISGSVELNNVYFRYTDTQPYILNGVSLKIKAGEYVAIVGRTGCGKSTLMRLLLGFEKPVLGAIYYDGRDMKNLDLRSLRRKIGSVTQNGGLFQGDIFSNIIISAPDLTLDDAWKAAETAGIADDIRAMPMGMNTILSEGQGGISGGQKQRIMIARAIACRPRLLIFDEATSALDNKTQKQISEALDKMGCTRIIIAHRLSTIKNCDRILVLEGGNIIEDGSYDELIAKGGYFAELVERQQINKTGTA